MPESKRPRDTTESTIIGPETNSAVLQQPTLHILIFYNRNGVPCSNCHPLLPNSSIILGRSRSCDLVIDDQSISRQHARLSCLLNGSLEVRDLESANGTWLDGHRLESGSKAPVAPGTALVIGNAHVEFYQTRGGAVTPLNEDVSQPINRSLQEFEEQIRIVAPRRINVLILGETGVGKEVAAEAIHAQSPRARGPLVKLNCAALSETVLESELFGHKRGAFTNAAQDKPGLLETADGGTLFLDEVGDLPEPVQVKLLRFLQSGELRRVGELQLRKVDARLVSATNRDLKRAINDRIFRSDLYYRLSGFPLRIPPLRDRIEQIESLAQRFVDDAAKEEKLSFVPSISHEALAKLRCHAWPGNIRELRDVIKRALVYLIHYEHEELRPEHIKFDDLFMEPLETVRLRPITPAEKQAVAPIATVDDLPSVSGPLWKHQEMTEKAAVIEALRQSGGNQSAAAKRLGISRGALIKRLDKYELPRPRKE